MSGMTPQSLIQKRCRLRKLSGEKAFVATEPVQIHIASLRAAGWSIRSIAGESGVDASTVSRVGRGAQPLIRPDRAAALLALDPDTRATKSNCSDDPFVSRVGTVRRLQALMAMGWPGDVISRRLNALGVTDKRATYNLLHQDGQWVTRSRHDAVATVYRDLSRRLGPSERTRTHALARGYAGPARWDDIDLDEAPDKAPEFCATDGCLNQALWIHYGSTAGYDHCAKHRARRPSAA